jgi:hypothetical protein
MSFKTSWPNSHGQCKKINGITVSLGRAFDLTHGKGWMCQTIDSHWNMGYGFHKTNKFTAVHEAMKTFRTVWEDIEDLKSKGLL